MATVVERVSVLETKVDGINEKIDNVQDNVKENHQEIKDQLETMYVASCTQHAELNKKISDLEQFKNKWTYIIMGGVAVGSFMIGHFNLLSKVFGA
jgi:predicted HicB family RNase H-like nuclease